MAKSRSHSNNGTISSFKVSNLVVKKCKSFTEGEFVKERFLEISANHFEGFKNKKEIIAVIQYLQLSRITIVRRIEKMCRNIEELLKDFFNCVAMSLEMDESQSTLKLQRTGDPNIVTGLIYFQIRQRRNSLSGHKFVMGLFWLCLCEFLIRFRNVSNRKYPGRDLKRM
jgi:hypothetical protein